MSRDTTLPATCEQTVVMLSTTLVRHGFRVERSFDLRSALRGGCPCPPAQCACQYVVLLVYETVTMTPPAMVSAHECDGVTRLRVEAGQPGGRLSPKLTTALDEAMSLMTVNA